VKVVLRPKLRLRLKENFDRFNFALYKEKQMADFRRWFTVLAVLAVVAISASAQVGVATGSANSALLCSATGAGIPALRPEGYTELIGDILISCTGGPTMAVGAPIPTTNITVYMSPAVPITSRFLQSNGASEALLIIDEAGSLNVSNGTVGYYGPKAPQVLCTYAQEIQGNAGPCAAVVGTDPGLAGDNGPYEVAVTAGTTNPAPNVFQGKVGDLGPQTVTFYNVPVLPPASTGVSRVFRITNVRIPAVGYTSPASFTAVVSTSPNQTLPVAGTAINVGIVALPLKAAVQPVSKAFQQCVSYATPTLSASLIYTEGFATAFKTRVVPLSNTTYAAEATNTGAFGSGNNQNIPGGLYAGFAANSESGFIFPALNNGVTATGSVNVVAGLADYGTRLKAVFTNIPAGLTLYVSNTSINNAAPSPIGGTSITGFAVLVATNSGEANADTTNGLTGAFTPVGTTGQTALSANTSGQATAVWEVTNANPSAIEYLSFGVYIAYTATSATTANPYGLPITDLPLNAPVNNVAMSFAPEPGGGTFTTANATAGTGPIPRFAIINTYQGRWTTIGLCQTTLLYPFVTGASGFDTGIAVANTSWDPWNTVNQTGSCKLYGYGVTVASAGNTASQPVVQGCDMISNPLPGTNCFPIVPAGQVQSVLASATLSNFQGYVIAVCNFQYAHGYAAVTDLGIRNLWSSYLALEIAPLPAYAVPGTVVGSPRTGAASIEELVH
jgi:hypothetical protein